MRNIEITPEIACSLRDLLRRAQEAYVTNENTLKEMRSRCAELTAPLHAGEFAALCKDNDRIEVVTHAAFLDERNKGHWL
jgi:hypothetical protein